jgi:hypothetical protein
MLSMGRKDVDQAFAQVKDLLEQGVPRMEIARILRCRYQTLKSRIDKWGLAHLKNQQRRGREHPEGYKPAKLFLDKDSKFIGSSKLKKKLILEGIKKEQCEICSVSNWMGRPLPLELDHINGDRFDNRLENLRILCPNCHSQTPTNSGKNIGKYGAVAQSV